MKKKNRTIRSGTEFSEIKEENKPLLYRIIRSDLFFILFAAAAFRIVYYFCLKPTYNYWDSITYLVYNANIFHGETDAWRTPLYPAFLKLIALFGESPNHMSVIIAQGIISFVSIVFFWLIAKEIFRNRAVINVSTVLYAIMPAIIDFDLCILTESLSISFIVFIVWFFVRLLKKPTVGKAVFFSFFIFLSIMLRPSYISLLAVIAVFWLAWTIRIKEKRHIPIAGLVSTIICVLLIFGYSNLNYRSTGCNSLTLSSTLNQFDIVVNSGIYKDGNDQKIIDTIDNNPNLTQLPWNEDAKYAVLNNFAHEQVSAYLKSCVYNNPGKYIRHGLNKLLLIGKETTAVAYAVKKNGSAKDYAEFVNKAIAIPFFVIYIFLLLEFVLLCKQWLFKKKSPWFRSVLWAFIAAQIFTIIFGAQAEYQRLFLPCVPLVIILLSFYADRIISAIDKKRYETYKIL